MNTKLRHSLGKFLASALLLTSPVRLLAQAKAPVAGQPWALVGGTVYFSPTEAPIKDSVILIRSGAIAAVGRKSSVRLSADTQKLDCTGRCPFFR